MVPKPAESNSLVVREVTHSANPNGNRLKRGMTAQTEGEDDSELSSDDEDMIEEPPTKDHEEHVIEPDLIQDSFPFRLGIALITAANLQVMAMDVDFNCRAPRYCGQNTTAIIWSVLEHIFTGLFLVEWIFRVVEARPRRFFLGERTKAKYTFDAFNIIDTVVIFLRILDCWILTPAGVQSGLKLLSPFRIVHLGPLIKLVQLHRSFRELWLVISAVQETLVTLMWVGLLIVGVTWVMAILITISVLHYGPSEFNYSRAGHTFDDYWSTVGRTLLSLVQIMTRDRLADSLVWPLVEKDNSIIALFVLFYSLATLALMNNVTGVVVESILASSKRTEEREAKEKERFADMVMGSLRQIFRDADADGSGKLDREELHEALRKHRVRDRLKLLQIPFRDLDMLFMLFDEGDTGCINTDQFFRGVSRLRGISKASDLHQMSIDLDHCLTWCDDNHVHLVGVNDVLCSLVDSIDDVDTNIVHGDTDDKDPIVAARRAREKFSTGNALRGTVREGIPVGTGSKDPWLVVDEPEAREVPAKSGGMSKAERQEKKKKKKQKILDEESQPPPPPLPDHLQILKDQMDQRDQKTGKKKKKTEKGNEVKEKQAQKKTYQF